MSTTLYRKYRPQQWKDLVDQNHIKITLQHAIERNTITHAYLFSGPRGLGKTSTARIFAKAVNCMKRKKGSAEPCFSCDACQSIQGGHALDVIEIDAASYTGVDHVREHIIAASHIAPAQLPYKVFIIDEVHMLSISAFNALLKTLEEPPSRVLFILATTEVHRVPETILSRCQRFDFRSVPQEALIARLQFLAAEEQVQVSERVLERIAAASEGSVRDADSLFGQVCSLGEKHITEDIVSLILPHTDIAAILELLQHVTARNASGILALCERLEQEGVDGVHFFDALLETLRALLLECFLRGKDQGFTWKQIDPRLRAYAQHIAPVALLALLDRILLSESLIRKHASSFFALEVVLLNTFSESLETTPSLEKKRGFMVQHQQGKEETEPSLKKKNEQSSMGGEQKEKTKVTQKEKGAQMVTIEQIQESWIAFLHHIEKRHPSSALLLRSGHPIALEDACVQVMFPYQFHVDRLHDAKVTQLIEKEFQEYFHAPFRIRGAHDAKRRLYDAQGTKGEQDTGLLQKIVETFGGEAG